MTISEFLLARIAEDEMVAQAAVASWPDSPLAEQGTSHVERQSPRHVLADCEAKRGIVELHPVYRGPRLHAGHSGPSPDYACETCHATSAIDSGSIIEALGDCETLCILASIYADHPDYDPEWTI